MTIEEVDFVPIADAKVKQSAIRYSEVQCNVKSTLLCKQNNFNPLVPTTGSNLIPHKIKVTHVVQVMTGGSSVEIIASNPDDKDPTPVQEPLCVKKEASLTYGQ